METLNWIKEGVQTWWSDPAGETSGFYEIVKIFSEWDGAPIHSRTMILITNGSSEAEVFACELTDVDGYKRWHFIEIWHPEFHRNSLVNRRNFLEKYISGEYELRAEFSLEAAIEEQRKIDYQLFTEAYLNYAKRRDRFESEAYNLAVLRDLWDFFGDVEIDEDDMTDRDFLYFEAGTNREDVWRWFDGKCPTGLGYDLMYT